MPLSTPAETFARIEKAHASWIRGGATISVSNVTPAGAKKVQFRLDLTGAGGATLRIKTPPIKGFSATDQAFFLTGKLLTGVDFDAHEKIYRPVPASGSLGLRLMALLGGIDDSVGFLTDSGVRARYLNPLKALDGWKRTPNGLLRQTFAAGKKSLTKIDLDASGRLKGLHVQFPNSRLDWTIVYGPAKVMNLPTNYRRVEAFTARPLPPKYADATAKRRVETMLLAGSRLQNAIVKIDGNATLWIAGSLVRYENGGSGFAYDGRTLTIKTPGAAYQGKSSRGAVIDYAAELLGNVDPLVRSVLVRTPIYGEVFTPDAKVRVVGTMASGGQSCDVLAIESPHYRASMFVRKRDNLPASIETEGLDRNGNAVSRTTRTLTWSSVGGALPKSLFALRLRSGQTVLPLPKRKINLTGP